MDNEEIIKKIDDCYRGDGGKFKAKLELVIIEIQDKARADGFKEGYEAGKEYQRKIDIKEHNKIIDVRDTIDKNNEQKIRADERAKVMKEVEYLKRYDFEVAKQIFDELDKIKLDGYNCDLWLVKDYQNIKKRFLGDWLVKDYQNIKKKYLGDN